MIQLLKPEDNKIICLKDMLSTKILPEQNLELIIGVLNSLEMHNSRPKKDEVYANILLCNTSKIWYTKFTPKETYPILRTQDTKGLSLGKKLLGLNLNNGLLELSKHRSILLTKEDEKNYLFLIIEQDFDNLNFEYRKKLAFLYSQS